MFQATSVLFTIVTPTPSTLQMGAQQTSCQHGRNTPALMQMKPSEVGVMSKGGVGGGMMTFRGQEGVRREEQVLPLVRCPR